MKCVECKQDALEPTTVQDEVRVGEHVFRTVMPAERCTRCGETYLDNADLVRFDLLVARALGAQGVLTAAAFTFMRRALGLKGAELAELLGVRPETVSRWENDRIPLDSCAFMLLGSLVQDRLAGSRDTADRLEAVRRRASADSLDLTLDLASA